ncbi:hypothetical protein [Neobacillus drentensis]|uniref:hypothetical protein n=1 Tax=Neobacillus drentensis TaxID=220684 RepID=UPI002856AB76|nr:hypothetical protein [Neobacillus drentensis]MDR7237323.1 hypothetical protein [Neobacillus drentensis]
MKARISTELEDLINNKIFLDLEIHILTKKMEKARHKNDFNTLTLFEQIFNEKFKELKTANDLLRKQNVKVHKPVEDGEFVQYNFYVKENSGYKEGYFRYWKSAIKYKLKQRLDPYFRSHNCRKV